MKNKEKLHEFEIDLSWQGEIISFWETVKAKTRAEAIAKVQKGMRFGATRRSK